MGAESAIRGYQFEFEYSLYVFLYDFITAKKLVLLNKEHDKIDCELHTTSGITHIYQIKTEKNISQQSIKDIINDFVARVAGQDISQYRFYIIFGEEDQNLWLREIVCFLDQEKKSKKTTIKFLSAGPASVRNLFDHTNSGIIPWLKISFVDRQHIKLQNAALIQKLNDITKDLPWDFVQNLRRSILEYIFDTISSEDGPKEITVDGVQAICERMKDSGNTVRTTNEKIDGLTQKVNSLLSSTETKSGTGPIN